jgi:7,8-dihydropterin-6-yl-methyl-4-(beta-D-ribofuranosyl)aminobenzene 5'-phosphate synthase
MPKIRITFLVDNTASRNVLAEHGLSLWIELGDHRVLFDTGQGHVLEHNSRRLDIDPANAEAVVISHGHYDHTGGLPRVLADAPGMPVYAHPAAFEPKYARNPDGTGREIGAPPLEGPAGGLEAQIIAVEGPTEACEGLMLTGPVPTGTEFEDTGGPFYADPACTEEDHLVDDQSAFMEGPEGTIVLLGCAHSGVVNTLRYVQTLTNEQPVHTVVGGMHLVHAEPSRIEKTIAAFREIGVQRLAPCHCTGFQATASMWNAWGKACTPCRAGSVLEW